MSDPEGSTVNSRLREAAKKVFFSGMATKRGGGVVRPLPLGNSEFKLNIYTSNTFWKVEMGTICPRSLTKLN